MDIGRLTATLGIDATGLDKARTAMLGFEKTTLGSLSSISQKFRTFGYLATATLTAPMVMAGKASMDAASSFEFSMQKIVGLVGIAQNTTDEWRNSLLKMGPEVAQSPQKLAEALYFVTSAGFKSAKAMDIVNIAAKGATAGLGEVADISKLLVFTMNSYKQSGLDEVRVMDIFTAAVREGAIEADGFAGAMQSVLPIASSLGVTIDGVAGTMAALSLQGATAANSATYLRGMLNSLLKIKPGSAAEKSLNALGTSGESLLNMLKEPNGLMNVLLKLQDLSNQNTGNVFLKQIFRDIRGMTGALSLTGQNLEQNLLILDKVTNSYGDFGKTGSAVADTIKVRMDKLKATVDVLKITFGSFLAEVVLPLLQKLTQFLDRVILKFSGLTDAQKDNRITLLLWVAAIGPASLLISLLGYSLTSLIAVGKGVIWVFNAMKVAMMSNPYSFAIAAILSLVAAFVLLRKKQTDVITGQGGIIKIFEESDRVMAEMSPIEDRMKVLNTLNRRQVQDLKQRLDAQKAMEEDFQAASRAINYETMGDDQQARDWKIQAEKSGDSEIMKIIDKRISDRKVRLKKELLDQRYASQDRYNTLVDFEKRVDVALKLLPPAADAAIQATEEERAAIESATEALYKFEEAWVDIHSTVFGMTAKDFMNLDIPGTDIKKRILNPTLKPLNPLKLTPQSTGAEQRKVMDELAFSLDYINIKENALNKTLGTSRGLFESSTARINAYSTALEGYLAVPVTERGLAWTEGITDTITQLGLLQKEFDKVAQKKEIFNILSNGIMNMLTAIGGAVAGIKGAWTGIVDVVIGIAQQLIAVLLSAAAAAIIAGETIKGFGIPGLIIGMIGVGALAALWANTKGNMSNAAQLANGGIIPSGYPNDTYPALLSSGETVLPKALNGAAYGNNNEPKEVLIRFQNGSLEGYLNYSKRRVNSFA